MIADIPGLIEGASAGAGLGHDFLAHVERTRLLVHVLDLAPLDGSDPEANHATVERELELHNPRLAILPRVLALSKADLVDEDTRAAARARWAERLGPGHAGGRDLLGDAGSDSTRSPASCCGSFPRRSPADAAIEIGAAPLEAADELAEHRVFRPAAQRAYEVVKLSDGAYRVTARGSSAWSPATTSTTRMRSPTSSAGSAGSA